MRRVDHDANEPVADGRSRLSSSLDVAALLADGVRRRVFQAVRRARRPVTRDEVAASAQVSRNLAAFHLDKLVAAGLLRAGVLGSARSVGRRPKVYGVGPVEVHLDIPARQHVLLASVLAEALSAGEEARSARRAAADIARRCGRDIGRASPAGAGTTDVSAALHHLGFEPYEAEPSVVRLANCPFLPVAAESRELVCGLNLALVEGLVDGLEAAGVAPVLAPRTGECCVELRLGSRTPGADAHRM